MSTSRRDRQAAETRREILDAARRLFAEHGYAQTSMAQIAAAAGVSVQTIYDSVGAKASLVAALNDRIDEEGDVAALAGRIPTTTDGRQLLEVPIAICRNINERVGDIAGVVFGVGTGEPAMEALRVEGLRRHHEGCARLAGRLAEVGALRDGLDVRETGDVIAAMTHPTLARTYVHDYGWTWPRWHDWTLETLATLLLR